MNTVLRHWRLLPAGITAIAAATLVACGGSDDKGVDRSAFRAAGMVYAAPQVTTDAAGNQTVSVAVLAKDGMKTLSTTAVSAAAATAISAKLVPGNLVDWLPAAQANQVTVATDAAQTFNVVLSKGTSAAAQFDLAKYGPEVSRNKDIPGPMVAAGWVYAKAGNTITVGDGRVVLADMAGRPYASPIKRYEETYTLAPDVKVFNVDTSDYSKSAASTVAAIPVTADYAYSTTARQAAYLLFDTNHTELDKAKVVAIWYFTPQSTSDGKPVWDVPSQSPLLADKGTDPVSGQAYMAINATGVTAAPYTRSTEPFEMVKDTMYYVGDNEVASYILRADMGTPNDKSDDKLIKIDAGWANSGYQYWKNMELLGLDPRAVTDIWLTHGHGDHYGTVVEQLRMADNAGKTVKLWASREDVTGITQDQRGNVWNIAGALPASETEIRARTTDFYQYDQWYDYGNVQIMVIWSPGHTPGTTNMLFRVKNPVDGKFVTFGYHGGYGVNGLTTPTAANGFLRLSFQAGFSYLQQSLDVDFVSPQHTNQFPIVEVYQALKAYNRDPANANKQLTMLEAMRSKVFDSPALNGTNITSEFANQLEKRRSVISYAASDAANTSYKSIETSGPFKPGREAGATVTATLLDGGKIVQGFVGPQNKNPAIPLLANGIVTATDQYVNDPTGFYVQVAVQVNDGYQGYLPNNFVQFSPGVNQTITYRGGPVESVHAKPGEVLRTKRLNSLAEAQAILATIAQGRQVTLTLTPASEIVVPADVTQTFR
nr:MBL fold metallo-hydrolase [Variovorax boronicumulans]